MSFPPHAVIKGDLPCKRCAYNLRTLSPLKRCPECGDPVLPSIEAYREKLVVFERPLMAVLGLDMLALAFLIDAVAGVFAHYRDYDPHAGDDLRCGALIAGGAILLAFSDEKTLLRRRGRWFRLPFIATGMAFGARLMLGFFVWLGFFSDDLETRLADLAWGTLPMLLQIAATCTLALFALRIARRLGERRALAGAMCFLFPLVWPVSVCMLRLEAAFESHRFLVMVRRTDDLATLAADFHAWMILPAIYCLWLALVIAARRKESEALVEIGVPAASLRGSIADEETPTP